MYWDLVKQFNDLKIIQFYMESNAGTRCVANVTYLDAEAERERHGDHDEEDGQGRQHERGEPRALRFV